MDFHFDSFDANTTSSSSGVDTSTSRHASISIIPHFTGLLSVLGSFFIVLDILHPRNRSKKLATVYHRLLLGMSLSDLFSSAAMALSTWPIPQGSKVYAASGNQLTCTAQGFFVQLGTAAPLYNGFLALYYLLMVRYNWSETHGPMIRFEKIFHGFAWVLTLGTAFAALGLEQYNSANLWCWIAPLPNDCVTSSKSPDGTTTCQRGDNAWIYRIAFYFIWLWISLIVVTISMGLVVHAVWFKARQSRRYKFHKGLRESVRRFILTSGMATASDSPPRKKTTQEKNVSRVAVQAVLFIGAFYLTAVFPSIVRMTQAKWNCTATFYPLSLLTVVFYPLQGFWNFFIYVRPRYLKYRKVHPQSGRIRAVAAVLGRTIGLVCCQSEQSLTSGITGSGGSSGATTTTHTTKPSVHCLSTARVGDVEANKQKQGGNSCNDGQGLIREKYPNKCRTDHTYLSSVHSGAAVAKLSTHPSTKDAVEHLVAQMGREDVKKDEEQKANSLSRVISPSGSAAGGQLTAEVNEGDGRHQRMEATALRESGAGVVAIQLQVADVEEGEASPKANVGSSPAADVTAAAGSSATDSPVIRLGDSSRHPVGSVKAGDDKCERHQPAGQCREASCRDIIGEGCSVPDAGFDMDDKDDDKA